MGEGTVVNSQTLPLNGRPRQLLADSRATPNILESARRLWNMERGTVAAKADFAALFYGSKVAIILKINKALLVRGTARLEKVEASRRVKTTEASLSHLSHF
jgi:hypothetical protein